MTTLAPLLLPAHGVGSREDLPLPFAAVVIGAALALVVSFVALGLGWRAPRMSARDGIRLPAPVGAALDSTLTRTVARVLSVALTLWTLAALVLGKDNDLNPVPHVVYVWLWVGLAFASILLGPIWAVLNPVRLLQAGLLRAARVDADHALLPYRLGWWPAASGLLAFVALELLVPENTTLPVLRIAVLGFIVVDLLLGLVFGRDFYAQGDPFEVWSRQLGRLSPLARADDGSWVLRSPVHGPTLMRIRPGLVAVTAVMLGSTAYDSFAGQVWWFTFVQTSSLPSWLLGAAALVGTCLVVAGMLWVAASASARLAKLPPRGLTAALAPSLIPIAAGYLVAHYWSLWVYEGANGLALLSDPLGSGADLLGTGGVTPSPALIQPAFVATLQVVAIVVGHILGVVVAHEKALRLFDRRVALIGQLPLMLLMVGYTCAGLTLLFTG